tara:strand:+ start:363 stop:629 length:267 start_codon:yes stop_codon:yes gene_type:complete
MISKEYKKSVGQKLYRALIKRYESKIYEAKSILAVYFMSSVGIGEHSQILEEMDKYLTVIVDSEDKKGALERHFDDGGWERPFIEDNA